MFSKVEILLPGGGGEKKKKAKFKLVLWSGFWSRSQQHRGKVMPWHFLIFYFYCRQTFIQLEVLSRDKYLLNLKLVKLFFPLEKSFTIHLFPVATILYQIRSGACSGAAFRCQNLWASGAFLPKHICTPISTGHRAVTFALKIFKDQGS